MLKKTVRDCFVLAGLLTFTLLPLDKCLALDTDAYQVNSQQNTYLLLDTSGSMQYGVYEHNIDYAAVFDALRAQSGIKAPVITKTFTPEEIYLIKGDVKMVILPNGKSFTGDAGAVPMSYANGITWDLETAKETYAKIEAHSVVPAASGTAARITFEDDSTTVKFDDTALPFGLSIPHHIYKTLYDGSSVDSGFAGLLEAPGYYFSGYEGVGDDASGHDQADNGDTSLYFFASGNWLNYQMVCGLDDEDGHSTNELRPWQKYSVTLTEPSSWVTRIDTTDYPVGDVKYSKNLNRNTSKVYVSEPGATKIKVHFRLFDIETGDKLSIYEDNNTNPIAVYTKASPPPDNWSVEAQGSRIELAITSDNNIYTRGYGFTLDEVAYSKDSGNVYKIQSRLDVATDSIFYVLDEFRENINWGYAYFNNGDGASFHTKLNPTLSDINRQSIQADVKKVTAYGGTPLGEALQDIFQVGYNSNNGLKNAGLRKSPCSKNYAIVLSDGFPSDDTEWNRIDGVTFTDFDGDGYTYDPSQAITKDYYDDVAHWMYTHSWIDKTAVTDPLDSYDNITTHHIAFATENALLEDAAGESGGIYITAYNKSQLMHALQSVAQMISHSISFTAPAVSVDAENKIQNGDELYMGLFLPKNSRYWVGNLKKFKFGNGSVERPDVWGIYDAANNIATDDNGEYFSNTVGFWKVNGVNSATVNQSGVNIQEDGVGEVLTKKVLDDFNDGSNFYQRKIRMISGTDFVDFAANVTNENLAVDNDSLRKKIINWVYGYTFDEDDNGHPTGVREWALGPIVHSRPVVIDYYNSADPALVDERFIAIGAGDGMLHVFDDDDGKELLGLIPDTVLGQLKNFETEFNQPLVDGEITLVREKADGSNIAQPKYLIFSQRRGGNSVVALDIANTDPTQWKLAWQFSSDEMVQSWSSVEVANLQTGSKTVTNGTVDVTTATYTPVAIFTGGYDPGEDNYPEPFNDSNNNGVPDTNEWSKNVSEQDPNGNKLYDTHNADGDNAGRALYVVELATGKLVYSMENCPTNGTEVMTGPTQTTKKFKYCFPASPAVITGYDIANKKLNVLRAIYTIDIYGNIFRFDYDYAQGDNAWSMHHVFSVNPGSLSASGSIAGGVNTSDPWRKVFYAPSVSWQGSGYFFDHTNYLYDGVTFENTQKIASLFFGTGDRVHPAYNLSHDRVYAVYDDTVVRAEKNTTASPISVSSAPYTENNLLNLTCDELGIDTMLAATDAAGTAAYKTGLNALLTDDVRNQTSTPNPMELDSGGNGENDAKGWYVILDQQATGSYCDHCTYKATIENTFTSDRDNHFGEKIFSRITLYAGVLYFTSYQPSFDDPCEPEGSGLTYALNYLNASAALNLNLANDAHKDPSDPTSPLIEQKDITDRYRKTTSIKALPAPLSPVMRKGKTYIPNFGEIEDRDRPIYYWIERNL